MIICVKFVDNLSLCSKISLGEIMEAFLIFLTAFITLVSSVSVALLVPLRQYRLRIDPRFFKRIKVKFPAFMFAEIGGSKSEYGNVKDFGVIIPMFILHIVGYVLALFIGAIVPVLYYRLGIDTDVLFVIPLGIAVLYVIAVVVTEYLCVSFSRKKQLEQQTAKQPTEQPVDAELSTEEQEVVELAVVEQSDEEQFADETVEQVTHGEEPIEQSDNEMSTDDE